ncbi:MAG: hypothetical protein IIB27_04890 [Chloroflexi bacterium]|nr:hypothetical protein [Chloroflexota bacterium]
MTDSTDRPNYFMYFNGSEPAHFRWSSAMASVLGFSPWGGSEIGDVDRVGRRLIAHIGYGRSLVPGMDSDGRQVRSVC